MAPVIWVQSLLLFFFSLQFYSVSDVVACHWSCRLVAQTNYEAIHPHDALTSPYLNLQIVSFSLKTICTFFFISYFFSSDPVLRNYYHFPKIRTFPIPSRLPLRLMLIHLFRSMRLNRACTFPKFFVFAMVSIFKTRNSSLVLL